MGANLQTFNVSDFPLPEWRAVLFDSASEVFQLMVGGPLAEVTDGATEVRTDTTAMVGIAGTLQGVFSIRCSKDVTYKMASKMLGIPENEVVDQNWDAIAEICNMVAGNFKSRVNGLKENCMLSVPTVIFGEDYEVHSLASDGERLQLSVAFEESPLFLTLEVHR